MEIFIWSLTIFFSLVGIVGVLIPMLPGTTLIWLGMLIHKLALPADISWSVFMWISVLWILSLVVDFAGVALGAKCFGGSKWGMAGATGGAFLGMFFSLPALLFGTMLGAVFAEKVGAGKDTVTSLRSGVGATLGFFLSTVGRLLCAVGMIWVFLGAAL